MRRSSDFRTEGDVYAPSVYSGSILDKSHKEILVDQIYQEKGNQYKVQTTLQS